MKILYGVQGTGNGHITRARVMAKALRNRNDVEVHYLFSGRAADKYFDMDVFGDYEVRHGLSFVHQRGAIDKWGTARAIRPMQFMREVKNLDVSAYDLVLNDFEPVTAWAARCQGVPCLSISHQASFRHAVPKQGAHLGNRLLLNYFAPATLHLGVHWYHFGQPIMPPFVEDLPVEGVAETHILVYLPFESVPDIARMLSPLRDEAFVCYHPDISEEHELDNIRWRRPCKQGFHQALRHAKGVIANGGFELASECLKLGKKILIKPLQGQFEQLSNAITLEHLGLCHSMRTLDTEAVATWLQQSGVDPIHFPSDPTQLIEWLLAGDWQDVRGICHRLWQDVTFPTKLASRLDHFP